MYNNHLQLQDLQIGDWVQEINDITGKPSMPMYVSAIFESGHVYLDFDGKDFDYSKFYEWCRQKHSEGYHIFISEYQMPDDFKCVWQKQVTCAMNQTITKKPTEKLFTL